MNKLYKGIILAVIGWLLALSGFLVSTITQKQIPPLRGSGNGFATTLATTSIYSVGLYNTGVQLSPAAGINCDSRVITTTGKAIQLSFGSLASTTLSVALERGTGGHFQAASSTVVYDAGIYGCGLITALGYDATTSVTISTFR